MLKKKYSVKSNVLIKNKITGDTIKGDVIDEKEIDGKQFWVFHWPERERSRLLLAKESYQIVKR